MDDKYIKTNKINGWYSIVYGTVVDEKSFNAPRARLITNLDHTSVPKRTLNNFSQ